MTSFAEHAQDFEREWWGDCTHTFGEEAKQITYAHRMGLVNEPRDGKWPVYDIEGKSVIDIGGGPTSLLLKCVNRGSCAVLDPCEFPDWVTARYDHAGIRTIRTGAEGYRDAAYRDEAWVYNCLQHTEDPQSVIETARAQAGTIRIFEWLETETNVGHPHTLHADDLNDWIGSEGQVDFVDENGAYGLAYYGEMTL